MNDSIPAKKTTAISAVMYPAITASGIIHTAYIPEQLTRKKLLLRMAATDIDSLAVINRKVLKYYQFTQMKTPA
ncbi:hypothetical protein [Chitinophaga rhizophila]|uniref:Uncharacterized protein n=1 Tax=Chitinophaga rhizophila TaxID=2866212 RepID=A0ABS7GLA1_9BACT|nr:hypothetical protein [Chitinophaga rhizophila]MBW8688111.1 hypothetical protein [Chitinophaga rhizophila]